MNTVNTGIFSPADILLPDPERVDYAKWSVIACDQFTSDPAYWEQTAQTVGDAPSTLSLTLPEIYLGKPDTAERIHKIHDTMQQYLADDLFQTYENALIYTERIQSDGVLRAGIIGKIDLTQYDYSAGSHSPVRATEATVLERIPPRKQVRQEAPLELPHIMLLIDDPKDSAIGTVTRNKAKLRKLYDTPLMNGGGSITGYLLDGEMQQAFLSQLEAVAQASSPLSFAVGDGNHSLATAKACYVDGQNADSPARYALVELVNLHSPALQFEAIHRIVTKVDAADLIRTLETELALSESPSEQPLTILQGGVTRSLYIHKPTSRLAVGSLQNALDAYLASHPGEIDYIHGTQTVERLSAASDAVGFLLPDMDKRDLFPSVEKDGSLPRKTFSLGHAEDKRYYIEARKIR